MLERSTDGRARVCVIGSINVDLVITVPVLPREGDTVLASTSQRLPGGKGANQALAAARLGGHVQLVARVGRDADAIEAVAELERAGVDLGRVRDSTDRPTGLAVVHLDAQGRNSIVVVAGANAELTVDEVGTALTAARPDVVLAQLEIPLAAARTAMRIGRDVGALTVLNAAPAPTHPLDFLDAVDLLIVNESEARSLDPQGTDEPRALAAALRALGPGAVVVSLGANGCAHADAGGAGVTAARAVQALDTTGAGDCFSAALAVRLAEGADLAGAVEFATGAAALAVQRLGAQAAMPSREAVDRSVRLSGSSGRTGSLQ